MNQVSKIKTTEITSSETKEHCIEDTIFFSIKNQGTTAIRYSTNMGGKVTLYPEEEDRILGNIQSPINDRLNIEYVDTNDIQIKIIQTIIQNE